jgi:hypothetical protein
MGKRLASRSGMNSFGTDRLNIKVWTGLLAISCIVSVGCLAGQKFQGPQLQESQLQEPQVWVTLIPENYTGAVYIIFNQQDGAEPEVENGKYIYRIPGSGILKTKAKFDNHVHLKEFYYISDKGERRKLDYLYPTGGPHLGGVRTIDDVDESSDDIFCTLDELITSNRGGGKIYVRQFLVGKVRDIDRMAAKSALSIDKVLIGVKP